MTQHETNTDQVIDGIVRMAQDQQPPLERENRNNDRLPYSGHVALILLDQSGTPIPPMLLQAADISRSGIGVTSRHMFHVGSVGAMQMLRSDGKSAIVGVKVRHCRYTGNMQHHSGFEFMAVPHQIKDSHFKAPTGAPSLIESMLARHKAA
jgi:hypothetical protein